MSQPRQKPTTIPREPITDERGDRILAVGQYNRLGPIIGLPLSIFGLISSIYFLTSRRDTISQTMPLLDIIIFITSAYTLYYCSRELLYFRHRFLKLTTTRLYGHDGRKPFDFPLNDIRSVTEETKKSQFTGSNTSIVVKATRERSVRLEQLKDLTVLQQAIRQARERARDQIRESQPPVG